MQISVGVTCMVRELLISLQDVAFLPSRASLSTTFLRVVER